MAHRVLRVLTSALIPSLLILSLPSSALLSSPDVTPPYPKAISELKDAIIKGLGFQSEGFKVSGFDVRDALVGQSVAYEFNVEIDDKVLPFKLLEDVNRWEYVDLPIFRIEEPKSSENGLIDRRMLENVVPVLAPFQLAGPMEIWIQDAKDMRLSLPHDVDAGVLRKVILAEGAVVTVKGARSVSLRHPVDLPLPFNSSHSGLASGLLTLAEHLRHASSSKGAPLLSLRIVGPTSLTSPSSSSSSSSSRLKLKRLAPGLVELSSPSSNQQAAEASSALDFHREAPTLLTPSQFTTLWPVASINGSNSNLLGFEKLLSSVLGPKANEKGSFRLLKADVSAQTFLKIGFGVEKKLEKGDGFNFEGYPEWRTKPDTVRLHFEVLAKVDGDKIVPERVIPVNPFEIEDSVAPSVLLGNTTMSKMPVFHPPPNPFTL
ncbi:Protein TUNICAMYCIN INDUCED 1 [Ancistrocladus abbreviatus]